MVSHDLSYPLFISFCCLDLKKGFAKSFHLKLFFFTSQVDLDTEKSSLDHNLSIHEASREKLESELILANREKAELGEALNQITRERDSIYEELLTTRRDVERQSSNVVRLAKEKEELTREKSSLVVQVNSSERENRGLAENIASLKSEKESLETALYDLQQTATKLEARKEALEAENQELLLSKEALTVDLQRVRKEKEIEEAKLLKDKELVEQRLSQTQRDGEVAL